MTIFVPIMIFGWLPFTLFLFTRMKPRKAAVLSLIFGWLFLPEATYSFPGLPDYTKITATSLPILFGALFFDFLSFKKLYPSKLDIPIIVWCSCAFASSISNGLGVYDGISGVLRQIFQWGVPYAIGKMYLSDHRGLRDLAIWIVIGGLVYIPFCIWEIRMAPTLHYYIYGFRTYIFSTTLRLGGYRPTVFLHHGLAVGLWMMSALLMGIWLWRTRTIRRLVGFPMGLIVSAQFVVTLLCRSLNSIVLGVIGFLTYFVIRSWQCKSVVLCLVLIPPAYIVSRDIGIASTSRLVEIARYVSDDRAHSLYGRLIHEEMLVEKAWRQPFFGWGGWGRNRVYDDYGEDISITDGLWIIAFGVNGLVGLISLGLVLLLPTIAFWKKYRHEDWGQPTFAPVAGLVCIIPLYAIDSLMNGMLNPVFTLAAGGILGWLANKEDDAIGFSEHETTTSVPASQATKINI